MYTGEKSTDTCFQLFYGLGFREVNNRWTWWAKKVIFTTFKLNLPIAKNCPPWKLSCPQEIGHRDSQRAHNCQKWKSEFLTCPCYKIYRLKQLVTLAYGEKTPRKKNTPLWPLKDRLLRLIASHLFLQLEYNHISININSINSTWSNVTWYQI